MVYERCAGGVGCEQFGWIYVYVHIHICNARRLASEHAPVQENNHACYA
jgi:hypothetical protein